MVFPALKEYGKSKPYLDSYQRFLLSVIWLLKQGQFNGKRYEYDEIKEFLGVIAPHINRQQFNNWIGK